MTQENKRILKENSKAEEDEGSDAKSENFESDKQKR